MSKKEPVGGIYKILIGEHHFYVGRAKDFKKRWAQHMSAFKRGKGNRWMLNLYRKLGSEAFVFTILETLPYEQQEEREQYYIDLWWGNEHCCNASKSSHGCSEFKHSDEAKAKISAAARNISDETRAKMSAASKSRVPSDETKAKISAACKGRVPSDKTRAKLSEAQKGKPGYWNGKTLSEGHKENMAKARKGGKNASKDEL